MLTIFSCPKDNHGAIALAQRNAVASWLAMGARVVLFENGDNLEPLERLGARVIPAVPTNSYGTPLVNRIFAWGQSETPESVVMYCNTDIILDSAPHKLALMIDGNPELRRFLIVGQRRDLHVTDDLQVMGVEDETIHRLGRLATLHQPAGIDYFMFNKPWDTSTWPPFALGRFRWDNWLIWRALQDRRRVIDATECVTAIHQEHDYSHTHEGDKTATYNGPECIENTRLALESGCDRWYTILDAPYTVDRNYRFNMR